MTDLVIFGLIIYVYAQDRQPTGRLKTTALKSAANIPSFGNR